MGAVHVTAIASLTPLEELDADPFLVDSRKFIRDIPDCSRVDTKALVSGESLAGEF